MNIAFIEPHIAVCGGIRRVIEFSNRLIERGHTVTWFIPEWVYASNQRGGWMKQLFNVYSLASIESLKSTGVKYDVVIFNEETQFSIAKLFPATVRVYYALHWAVLHKDYNMLRNCYNGGFYIMANSSWTADAMLLETSARPPIVYGGVTEELFHPVHVPKQYDILAYGATRAWKGMETVHQIVNKLKEEDSQLSFMKFGDNSGIKQTEMAEAYGACRVYLSASWYEGWGWCALESMACGTAVVMSDDGGCRDYAKDGYNCLMYPARDVEKAVYCIKKVLNDRKLEERLVQNGLETASRFKWEPEVVKMEELFLKWHGERTKQIASCSQK